MRINNEVSGTYETLCTPGPGEKANEQKSKKIFRQHMIQINKKGSGRVVSGPIREHRPPNPDPQQ